MWETKIVAAALIGVVAVLPGAAEGAARAAVTGTVFIDADTNGTWDKPREYPLSSAPVTITAYGDRGQVLATTTSKDDGTYTLDLPAGQPARLELTGVGKYPYHAEAPAGSGNGSTVQFVTAGDTGIDFAVHSPDRYCQQNPDLALPCYALADRDSADVKARNAVITFPYANTDFDQPAPTKIADQQTVGTLWGLAWNPATKTLYGGAGLHRHASLPPGGSGAVYAIDPSGGATLLTDLDAQGFATRPSPDPLATRDLTDLNTPSQDPAAFDLVGKYGLGDVEISADRTTLYVVNLHKQNVATIDIATKKVTGELAVTPPAGCPQTDTRPWALGSFRGQIYAGVTCSAQSSQDKAKMTGHIMRLGGSAFTSVFSFGLDYPRQDRFRPEPYKPWTDTSPDTRAQQWDRYAQPIVSDLEFLDNGDAVIALTDRYGLQSGTRNAPPTGPKDTTEQGLSSGDILRACASGSTWAYGSDTRCPAPESAPDYLGKEFYWDDGGEEESAMGALALVNSMGKMVFTAADPKFSESAGVFKGDNVTGKRDGTIDYQTLDYTTGAGKGNGLGDIEALCDLAPIEIGNRVWFDANKNGVQDPTAEEFPIPGVKLELLDASGAVISTATTDAEGTYLFSGYPGTSTPSEPHGLPLKHDTTYTVRIPNAVGASQQAPLTGYKVTKDHSTDDRGTVINDSDGTLASDAARTARRTAAALVHDQVTLRTAAVGRNNHSYDFGFWVDARMKIVKLDKATGEPLAGATFTVTGPGGEEHGPYTSTETGVIADGLAPGEYTVTETAAPPGYALPDPAGQKVTVETGKTATVTFEDPKTSGIKLVKRDAETGKPLAGASFTVADKDGTVIGTYTSTVGGVAVPNLTAGDYTVTEVTPPPGYVLPDPAGQKVTVTEGQTVTVTFDDTPSTVPPPHPRPRMEVRKKTDKRRVGPGGVLRYTITARNTGRVPYPGATWTDDLSDVLRKATYTGDAKATSGQVTYTAPRLRWRGDLPVGGRAEVTYSIVIGKKATGRIRNAVIWGRRERERDRAVTVILKEKPPLR